MVRPQHWLAIAVLFALVGAFGFANSGTAQRDIAVMSPEEAQAELARAQQAASEAEARASRLTDEAQTASQAADRTARRAAALAARIQQAEAEKSAAQARYSLARSEREVLDRQLADRQQPLVRLTAALQTLAKRPLALSALQPGTLRDTVYVRAVLDGAVPAVRDRTAVLRADLERVQTLEAQAASALADLRASESTLRERRASLESLEARQRVASRDALGVAVRERERALALAEEARDLDGLMGELNAAAQLRQELAALPGPVLRPPRPSASEVVIDAEPTPPATASARLEGLQLPVQGRTVSGFGSLRDSGLRNTGITIAPPAAAQVVAPAAGRVAFSGPYRGFGRIIIIEHGNGWTSLVTGLARTSVDVGDEVLGGSPLGVAADEDPAVSLELRLDSEPVNPLEYLN